MVATERNGTDTEREAAVSAVNRWVFPHAFAEESVRWPELRRVLPDGEALTLAGVAPPAGNALAAPPLSVLDRGQDLMDALARLVPPGPAARSRRLSGGLRGDWPCRAGRGPAPR